MEQQPEQKIFYLPETLGLDPANREDMILYVESGGDQRLAEYMLAGRDLSRQHNAGNVDDATYNTALNDLDRSMAARREAIGLPARYEEPRP